MKALVILIAISLMLFSLSCAEKSPKPEQKPNPFVMNSKEGIFLNTYALAQSDLPILGSLDDLPDEPEFQRLPEAQALDALFGQFARHGYKLAKDYRFSWGKIHVRFDGFDSKRKVGFVFITKEDYEAPIERAGPKTGKGLFYTKKSPDKFNVPEILMLERLNREERLYVALINAHQFTWPADKPLEENKAKFMKRLKARTELYLLWVDARIAKRLQEGKFHTDEPQSPPKAEER